MEGYLNKKGRGDSSFGRRNWKRRWFILESHILTYFEELDLETGIPHSQKGLTDVSGCEIVPVTETDKKFTFVIRHPVRNPLYLQADDAKMLNMWIKALSTASSGEMKPFDFDASYRKLGLDPCSNPTSSDINRAYRKAALKSHPDKGGDLAEFKQLQEAYEQLIAKLEEEEDDQQFDTISFEAVIQKGPQGVGVGMVVIENSKKHIIQVKKVMPDMMLKSLTAAADGAIRPGDVLVKVASEDVTGMPLARVVQKIGDLRVPVGSTVTLTFTRRIHNDGTPEEVIFPSSETAATPVYSSPPSYTPTSESGAGSDTPTRADYTRSSSSYNFDTAPPDVYSPPPSSPGNADSSYGWNSPSASSHLDPVQYVAALAENEELRSDLETALQQLSDAHREKEKATNESRRLREQLSRCKAALEESVRKQSLLETQLQQSLVYNVLSADQMAASMESLLSVPADLGGDAQQPTKDEHGAVKTSQRSAIAASAAVDKSGDVLRKWDTAGDSAATKLSRFEESLLQIERSRAAAPTLFQSEPAPSLNTAPIVLAPRSSLREGQTGSNSSQSSSLLSSSNMKYTASSKGPVLSPAASLGYRGLAVVSSPASGSTRSPLVRTKSDFASNITTSSSTGSGKDSRSTAFTLMAGKTPLALPKRPTPPVPLQRTLSSM